MAQQRLGNVPRTARGEEHSSHAAHSHAAQPSYILLSLSTLVAAATNAATSSATLLAGSPAGLLLLLSRSTLAPAVDTASDASAPAAGPLTAAGRCPVRRAVARASAAAAKALCLASARCLRLPAPLLLLLLLPVQAAAGMRRPCPGAGICMAWSDEMAAATVSAAPARLSNCSDRWVNRTCACSGNSTPWSRAMSSTQSRHD